MKNPIRFTSILILCFAFGCPAVLNGQARQCREAQAKVIMWANWDCFTGKYPKAKLSQVVKYAFDHADYLGVARWGDRAFAYDLNRDRKPEYIIPLICAAVGNCAWGVFAVNPARLLGFVYGKEIYIRRRVGRWAALTVYTHNSAWDGYLDTYHFKGRSYVKLPGEYYVNGYYGEPGFGTKGVHPYPKFMEISSPCKTKGNNRRRSRPGRAQPNKSINRTRN